LQTECTLAHHGLGEKQAAELNGENRLSALGLEQELLSFLAPELLS